MNADGTFPTFCERTPSEPKLDLRWLQAHLGREFRLYVKFTLAPAPRPLPSRLI